MTLRPVIVSFLICITASLNALSQNSAAPLKFIDLILSPDSKDWNYKINQPASVNVTVLQYGVPVDNVSLSYEMGPEMMPADKKGTLKLDHGTGTISLGSSSVPGFRQLTVKTEYQGKSYSNMVKVAYSPEKITPSVVMPNDFMEFWQRAMESSAKVPLDVIMTPLPEYSTLSADVFLVNFQNWKAGSRIYGYLCKPKKKGNYPVLFSPPGAGVKPMIPSTAYADRGFISLSIEIHGISPLLDAKAYKEVSNAFGDYWFNKLDDPENYYYKSVYLGCLRAVDVLCSLPEFDGKNVVVTGGSQGGALSIVTAALHKKVKCLAAFYPALCDMTGYLEGRAGGWPHLLNPRNYPQTNRPENLKTLSYYDVVNFSKIVKVPGFYSWGYNDNTCPPTSVYAAVNTITAPKTIVITPITGHWRFEETNQESITWLRKQVE